MGYQLRHSCLVHSMFCLICWTSLCCHAGNHYCPKGYLLIIDVTVRSYQDERIIGMMLDEKQPAEFECHWQITAKHLTAARQLVLQGIQSENATGSWAKKFSLLQYQLHQPKQNGRNAQNLYEESVNPGMFQVLPLTDSRTYLSIKFNGKEESQGRSPVILRALMPLAGFCSRDMLSFLGNCQAVSPVPVNVTIAMSNIKGDAQLASFISMAQVKEFVAANTARLKIHPYKQPLNLSQPVRIGMFYSATDARILSVVRNESSGCLMLQEVDRPEEMLMTPVTGACGSLRINETGDAIIEFGNCSKPMLALMSFPETPSSSASGVNCANCADQLRLSIERLMTQYSRSSAMDPVNPVRPIHSVLIVVTLAGVILVIILTWRLSIMVQRRYALLTPSTQKKAKKRGTRHSSVRLSTSSVSSLCVSKFKECKSMLEAPGWKSTQKFNVLSESSERVQFASEV